MTDFVDDLTSIPGPKTDLLSITTEDANKHIQASDWNTVRQAAYDLRTHVRTLEAGGGGGVVYPVTSYGTVDTPTNTRAALLAAADAANADGGGRVLLPAGTYTLDRDGANLWAVDWPYSRVSLVGDPGGTIVTVSSGLAGVSIPMFRFDELTDFVVRDIIFDGNWGNRITTVESGSHEQVMSPSVPYTLYVGNTTNMVAPGVVTVRTFGDVNEFVTYTGLTATTLTGCLGGTATLTRHDPVVYVNSATGINHTTQADPKSHALMLRGCARVLIERCEFRNLYGDAVWLGMPFDDDLYQPTTDVRITNCRMDTMARNAISFGAGVERIAIDHNYMANFWTCGVDSEPQGMGTRNRDIWIHHNYIEAWPVFPGGGQAQVIGIVSATPQGYHQNPASRGWRVHDNVLIGWTAINNSIDIEMKSNSIRTRFNYLGKADVATVTHGTDTIEATAHTFKTGDGPIRLWTDTPGGLPAGITVASGSTVRSVEMWIIRIDANNLKLADTFALALAGTPTNITSAGSGAMYLMGPGTIAPIYIDHACDEIRITDNFIYNNSEKGTFTGDACHGAIVVANYIATVLANFQPAGVVIENNDIHSHKGCHGVFVNSQGGFAIGDGTTEVAPSTGTATAVGVVVTLGVTYSTLTNSGAAWTDDQWIGWQVIMGGRVALIKSNTATVLTLYTPDAPPGEHGWWDAVGDYASSPAAGAYKITSTSGFLRIANNRIDTGAYADHTAGGYGIYLFNDRAGGRIEVVQNKIKNAASFGVLVVGATSKPIAFLELADNKFWDDQGGAGQTMSEAIRFNDAQSLTSITKLIMRGNTCESDITALGNVSAGYWLLSDGATPQWAGYGTPENAVTAPIGSTYVALDGGAGTTFWVKESGAGDTGWDAK